MKKISIFFILFAEFSFIFLGLTLPLVKVEQLWLFKKENSVIEILNIFFSNEEYFLFIIISLTAVIFPILKIFCRFFKFDTNLTKLLYRFANLDIFLIATLVYVTKSSAFIKVDLLEGFYFLCVGIILGLLQIENYLNKTINKTQLF